MLECWPAYIHTVSSLYMTLTYGIKTPDIIAFLSEFTTLLKWLMCYTWIFYLWYCDNMKLIILTCTLWAYLLYQNRFRFPKLSVPMVSTVSHKPKLVSLISQNGQFQFSAILSIFWKVKIKCFYDIIVMFSFIDGLKWVTVNTLNYPHSNTIKTKTK